jgi:hypothetical protein
MRSVARVAGSVGLCLLLWAGTGEAETVFDRPVAAPVQVLNFAPGHGFEVWVFACGADHLMRESTQPDNGSLTPQSPWTVVSNIPCASSPTATTYPSTPQDEIDLFYRSTSNHLIEVSFDNTGSSQVFDISTYAGLGNITGTPAISFVLRDASAVSVIVKQETTNIVYDWDWVVYPQGVYPHGWSSHPVTSRPWSPADFKDGPTVTTTGTVFSAYQLSGNSAYVAFKTNSQTFSVYRKDVDFVPFSFYNSWGPTTRSGVLTFGAPNNVCSPPSPCAMLFNDATLRINWWSLDYSHSGTISAGPNAGWSLFSNPSGYRAWSRTYTTGGMTEYFSDTQVVSTGSSAQVMSAPSPIICDQCQSSLANSVWFASGSPLDLWVYNGTSTFPMGYPGGILPP